MYIEINRASSSINFSFKIAVYAQFLYKKWSYFVVITWLIVLARKDPWKTSLFSGHFDPFKRNKKKKGICILPPINTLVQIGSLPWGTKSKYQGPQVPNRIIKVSKFIILISLSFIQTLMFCVKQTMGEMLTKLWFLIYVLCVNWKMAYM